MKIVFVSIFLSPNHNQSPEIVSSCGEFADEVLVHVKSHGDSAGAEIQVRYTLDGSDPDLDSMIYSTPLCIRKTGTVVKAIATRSGQSSSEVASTSSALIVKTQVPGITTGKAAAGQILRKIADDMGDSSDARPPVFSEKLQPLLRFAVLVFMGLCTLVFFDHLIRAVGQLDRTILTTLGPSLMQHMPFRPGSSTANGSPSLDPLASKNLSPAQIAVHARQMAAYEATIFTGVSLCLYFCVSLRVFASCSASFFILFVCHLLIYVNPQTYIPAAQSKTAKGNAAAAALVKLAAEAGV